MPITTTPNITTITIISMATMRFQSRATISCIKEASGSSTTATKEKNSRLLRGAVNRFIAGPCIFVGTWHPQSMGRTQQVHAAHLLTHIETQKDDYFHLKMIVNKFF